MRNCSPLYRQACRGLTLSALVLLGVPLVSASAQDPVALAASRPLTLDLSRSRAREVSAELTAARAAVAVATARERQGSAFANPTLTMQREQASANGASNSQLITALEQPLEIGGTRSARRRVLALRRGQAEAELVAAEHRLDFTVAHAFAQLLAADRRLVLSRAAASEFADAGAASEARFAAGDISGYTHRRLRLEVARYASLLAADALARRSAERALARLLDLPGDAVLNVAAQAPELRSGFTGLAPDDSLRALAARHRPDLRAATLGTEAARAEIGVARRERFSQVRLTAGMLNQGVAGGASLSGFVAGVAIPIPLWDRNAGAIDAASAFTDQRSAETEALRRRIATEVSDAADALRAIREQLDLLRPRLGEESAQALRAARVAYAEGEISLLEWLDAVRAYHEAEVAYAALDAEALTRRAALERALGISISRINP